MARFRTMKLPSNEELARLSPEQLLELLVIVRRCKEALANGGSLGVMPVSAVQDLAKAVPDDLVQAIVQDQRRGVSDPGWLPPDRPGEPVKRTGGWVDPLPLGMPPGVKWCDQQMDVADALDRRELERRLG